jgi:hypothetical protein
VTATTGKPYTAGAPTFEEIPPSYDAPELTGSESPSEAAEVLAEQGWRVFPVDHPAAPQCAGMKTADHDPITCTQRGKHPNVKFATAATSNRKMIFTWFTGYARNVGIAMGPSGLLVIDEDLLDAFVRYAADHGVQIPPTFVVKTANGRHYYFQDTTGGQLGNTEGALGPYGINVRSGNAYVVGPGSVHATGVVYTVEAALPVAPLPDWVIAAIKAKPRQESSNGQQQQTDGVPTAEEVLNSDPFATHQRFELSEVIKDHHRHNTLVSYASSLLARDCPLGEAKILFKDAWQRCEQPPQARFPITLEEAYGKLEDVYNRYPPGRSEGYRKASSNGEGDAHQSAAGPAAADAATRQARITWASEIEPQPVEWAWRTGDDGRIPAGSLSIGAGREGTGKSSFVSRCAPRSLTGHCQAASSAHRGVCFTSQSRTRGSTHLCRGSWQLAPIAARSDDSRLSQSKVTK